MKKYSKWLVFLLWGILILLLYQKDLLTVDINEVQKLIENNESYAVLLFLLFFSLRFLLFFPTLPFLIIGGVLFGTVKGFLLSMIGLMASLSFIYVITRLLSESKWKERLKAKNPKIMLMLERYSEKFLAIGILAPIANTDIVCMLTIWATNISYRKYILTVFLVNIPTVLVYSLLGNTYNDSVEGIITFGIFMLLNSIAGILILFKMKKDMKNFKEEESLMSKKTQ